MHVYLYDATCPLESAKLLNLLSVSADYTLHLNDRETDCATEKKWKKIPRNRWVVDGHRKEVVDVETTKERALEHYKSWSRYKL